MKYFDLHCDTLTECLRKDVALKQNSLHIDLVRGSCHHPYVQCYAAWIPDDLRGETAWQRFEQIADRLEQESVRNSSCLQVCRRRNDLRQLEESGKTGAVLTVENGAALGGRLENIGRMKERGVKMMTLTWNGENELGRGVMAPGDGGLTEFGRKAVRELEEAGIVIDLSHASRALFFDVARIARKPFVASHSNAFSVCGHPRNLEDDQFRLIKESGGVIGLNLYRAFLNNTPEKSCMEDVLRHASHFLELGGESVLAMGGDLDGAELPADMTDIRSLCVLQELFCKHGFSEEQTERIFYGNARDFFERNKLL